MKIPLSIDLSQEVNDEQTTDSEQTPGIHHLKEIFFILFTRIVGDPVINTLIANVEEEMSRFYCVFIVALFFFLICLCWPLLIFAYVMYHLITGDDPFDIDAGVRRLSWSRSSEIFFYLVLF